MTAIGLMLVIPLAAAVAMLLVGGDSRASRAVAVLSPVAQLGVAVCLLARTIGCGWVVLPAGGWAAPHGIALAVDPLAALMLVVAGVTVLAGTAYSLAETGVGMGHPLRLPLLQFLSAGINLSFCTADLFNLFVAFEVLLIASYGLLTLETGGQAARHAFPYVALNAFGSVLFFCVAGLAYARFGSLGFADIARRAGEVPGDPGVAVIAVLLACVFGLKAGLFPLYYWLPRSYPVLPVPLAAVFAGLLTKVGVYALIRLFATVMPHDLEGIHAAIAWVSGLTMLLGVIGAISRNFVRGILSFHILSQVAFMTLALGFFTPLSIAAAIFYIAHHIVVKSSLFLVGGVAARLNGGDDLKAMGNLWVAAPWLGVIFLAQALSLAGMPPLSGFWGKYAIAVVGIGKGEYLLVGASLLAGALTLFSMLKIWLAAFWRMDGGAVTGAGEGRTRALTWVCAAMMSLSIGIGLFAEPVMRVAQRAADVALDPGGLAVAIEAAGGKGAAR